MTAGQGPKAAQPGNPKRGQYRRRLESVGVFLAFLVIWEVVTSFSGIHAVVVPPPIAVVRALIDGLIVRGIYWNHIAVTVFETLAGFAIGALVGFALGVSIAEIRVAKRLLYPYIVAFQTIPKVAIAPLFVIWFGFGLTSKIIMAATISFFPVVINAVAGFEAADLAKIEMLRVFGATRWTQFKLARLPSALPFVFAGLDIAVVLSVIGAIVAEFVGSQSGIGYLIMQYNFDLNTTGVFALLLVLSAIGVVLHLIVVEAQKRIVFWAVDSSAASRMEV